MAKDILVKIKEHNLLGKGGAEFPVAKKWQAVKESKNPVKYIICNGAEGEPGVDKDEHIIKNHPQELVEGIKIALNYTKAKKAFLYLKSEYYNKYKELLSPYLNSKIELFKKPKKVGYLAGEEGTIINILENTRKEAKIKPPFPTEEGLFNSPTLINNVETFYDVFLVKNNKYEEKRFYSINGDCKKPGVYYLPINWSLAKILTETDNFPKYKFFVQVGGKAAGSILNQKQLDKTVKGCGAICLYKQDKHDPIELIYDWIDFYYKNSCGKCTPCREGTYRLKQIMDENERKNINWKLVWSLVENLEKGSFCTLGSSLPTPLKTINKNLNLQLK